MEEFEDDKIGFGGQQFIWTDPNPDDNVIYYARLTAPIQYNRHPQSADHWQASAQIALTSEAT